MADNEFKRLGRADLIEIIYQLQQNEQQLTEENQELNRQLADRRIKIENAGSIAEASLALNDIFIVAQNAADQYLEEVREANANAEEWAMQIIVNAQQQADRLTRETTRECAAMRQQTEEEIKVLWDNLRQNVSETLRRRSAENTMLNPEETPGVHQNE